jgi:hypothetical protein
MLNSRCFSRPSEPHGARFKSYAPSLKKCWVNDELGTEVRQEITSLNKCRRSQQVKPSDIKFTLDTV